MILLLACTGQHDGTIVGNPGDAMVVQAAPKGIEVVEAEILWDELSLTPCSGEENEGVGSEDEFVLGEDVLELPGGSWCGAAFGPSELWVVGTMDEVDVEVELILDRIDLGTSAFTVDGGQFLFELGEPDWLAADWIDERDDVLIDEGHDLHDTLAEAIQTGSGLYADDGDGALSEAERDAGPLTAGPDREVPERDTVGDTGEPDDDGGSCAVAPVGGFWLLGLLLVRRRR
ncbi:MAG: hypothetical protein GY913_03020 [Proteobacteria bacterium]|nr:hypothetical protein [Pseudomonadota bacterium]MCP4915871.1 hypothetical protein [Pseudomonadota bacterium]